MDNDIKNQEHKMKNFDRELEKCKEHVNSMEKEHEWIATEKEFFGEVGSDYDFEARNAKKVMKNMAALKIRQEALEKKINRKVMGMIQRAEKEYTDLIQKKRSLEDDRHKIEEVIATLDIKKKTAIEKTWAKVTEDFGAIFTDLLPGTSAKLEPEDGKSVIDGVRVRVAFSGVWKESLSELSGGQRSLVALSLILALLRFKPAPMYILDEVDAALDLSHTQNIGMMLRKHFTNSQFVVVSLKEGMFNNANCIFRTKFVDGMSTVRRSTPMDKKQQEAQNLFVDNANNINNKKKGKNKKSNKSRKALSSKN
jgi:structural maintenance of chromosome 2